MLQANGTAARTTTTRTERTSSPARTGARPRGLAHRVSLGRSAAHRLHRDPLNPGDVARLSASGYVQTGSH
jgi:hypothetical protein